MRLRNKCTLGILMDLPCKRGPGGRVPEHYVAAWQAPCQIPGWLLPDGQSPVEDDEDNRNISEIVQSSLNLSFPIRL